MNSAGDAEGAKTQLDEAERLFGEAAGGDDAAILTVERARSEARLGNNEDAIRLAREAIGMLGDQHGAILGTAFWALGDGLALSEEVEAASDAFERAVELLAEHRRWREALGASKGWARLLRSAGRYERALDVLERSASFTSQMAPDSSVRDRTSVH
jgi:tetratricopeptide (TPR) repeat protein